MQLKVVEQFQEFIALDRPDETTTMLGAKRPVPLIQSFAGPSLWAYLTVSRFADHLPYYRLEDILGRSGFRIDRSTQWRWMRGLARGVTPLVELMWERALMSAVLGMDETPVMELGGPGRTLKGYLWAGVGDANHPYDCFFYTSDRRSIRAETLLQGFQGYLTADAYVAYERIGQLWPGVFKASCWVHARRKFEACHHLGKTRQTYTALAYFRKLFDIEDRYRQSNDQERLAARREQSQPIVEEFREWLWTERIHQVPKMKMAGAINYMLNRWESFTRFLDCGAPRTSHSTTRAGIARPRSACARTTRRAPAASVGINHHMPGEQNCMTREIKIQLLPHERAAILRANFYVREEVEAQLQAYATSSKVETISSAGPMSTFWPAT